MVLNVKDDGPKELQGPRKGLWELREGFMKTGKESSEHRLENALPRRLLSVSQGSSNVISQVF